MKNIFRNEKGSITAFAAITILTFVVILTGVYLHNTTLKKAQLESNLRIQQVYGEDVNKVDNVYANVMQAQADKIEKLPSTNETSPYLPDDTSKIIDNSSLDTGLTVKDKNNNEWVWVVVPKSITTSTKNETEIYTALENYATAYRRTGWSDIWYNGCGLTEAQYNTNKNKMLNSIKTYGGFWIGRYELGTDTIRTENATLVKPALIQSDKNIYNWITCSQSQELCSELSPNENLTSSIMYGIQWDLTLKFIEEKAIELGTTVADRQAKLKIDSSTWGNYSNVSFELNKGKYSTNNGISYTIINTNYIKSISSILLTTGSTSRNRILNIYDFAGNAAEWTLDFKLGDYSYPSTSRSGSYNGPGMDYPSAFSGWGLSSYQNYNFSTRATLYQ